MSTLPPTNQKRLLGETVSIGAENPQTHDRAVENTVRVICDVYARDSRKWRLSPFPYNTVTVAEAAVVPPVPVHDKV